MTKNEVFKKYKSLCQQVLFVAQRARSLREELDDFKPEHQETALKFGPALELLDPHLYRDDTDLNTVKVFDLLISKCEDETFTCSDAVTVVSLIERGEVLREAFSLFNAMYGYEFEVPSPIEASMECMKAGLEL